MGEALVRVGRTSAFSSNTHRDSGMGEKVESKLLFVPSGITYSNAHNTDSAHIFRRLTANSVGHASLSPSKEWPERHMCSTEHW